jgi:uncharacterized membrane protein (UPF0182 family)
MDTRTSDSVGPWQRPAEPPEPMDTRSRLVHLLQYLLPAAILLLIAVGMVTGYLEKWLWMGELHYSGIFWTMFSVQWTMFAAAFVIVFAFMWLNLRQALGHSGALSPLGLRKKPPTSAAQNFAESLRGELSPMLLKSAVVVFSLLIAWFAAQTFFGQWDSYLRFRYGGEFGIPDPLFGVDVGFYVFELPFYQLLQTSLMVLTVVAIGGVSCIYSYATARRLARGGGGLAVEPATAHVSALLFILVANWGAGFYLDHYELVYSTIGVV